MANLTRYIMGASAAVMLSLGPQAFAQDAQAEPPAAEPKEGRPDVSPEREIEPETIPLDELKDFGLSDELLGPDGKGLSAEDVRNSMDAANPAPIEKPDYSRLTEAEERAVRLDALFERLGAEENPEAANLIAEEVWAIWLDSGSASVNMLLRRGTAAQKRGDDRLARRMYNHVIELSPDYAEGWARSARLALEEDDLSRALTEVTQALILEPRQFYAHWTLGNIFEKIGRTEAAYEAYKEANRLYPELMPVKDRLEMMKGSIEGDVL